MSDQTIRSRVQSISQDLRLWGAKTDGNAAEVFAAFADQLDALLCVRECDEAIRSRVQQLVAMWRVRDSMRLDTDNADELEEALLRVDEGTPPEEKCDKCGTMVPRRFIAIEVQDGHPIDDPAGFMWCIVCHSQRVIAELKAQLVALQVSPDEGTPQAPSRDARNDEAEAAGGRVIEQHRALLERLVDTPAPPTAGSGSILSLHRCKICGTRWLLWPDEVYGGGWNLLDYWSRPGSCCNNVAMGEQIEHLRDLSLPPAPQRTETT